MSDERRPSQWERQEMLVMGELKRLNLAVEDLVTQVTELKVQLATLTTVVQLKSGVWGALAGFLPALAMLILWLLGDRK